MSLPAEASRRERTLALVATLLVVLPVLVAEAYLVHRTYQYFGGGALNRPLALRSPLAYAGYAVEAVVYDVLFFGTLGLLLTGLLRLRRRLNPLQRWFIAVFSVLGVAGIVMAVRWKIYAYFKDKFDLELLKELAGGNLKNITGWVSVDQFLLLLLIPVGLVVLWWLVRRLRRRGEAYRPWRPSWRFLAVLALLWAVLIANHFLTASRESLRYGLSRKMSYAALDALLTEFSDFDGDGFGPLTTPPDPDNGDASVFPYALDEPGNGRDEDALGGDLPGLDPAVPREGIRRLERANGRNVIVVVVETLRADVIGSRVDGQPATPFLDSLVKKHAYTPYAYSNYGVTARAIQTVFAGSLHYRKGDHFLFDELRRHGYRTYAASAQDEEWGGTYATLRFDKLDRYFDCRFKKWDDSRLSAYDRLHRNLLTIESGELHTHLFPMLEEAAGSPFVLYVNYQDLHYPYDREEFPRRFIREGHRKAGFFNAGNRAAIVRQYANAAHHLDGAFKALFAKLGDLGILERTTVVIVGDHPDSFYENGILGHGWTVDEHQRRTSLLVVNGRGGEVVAPIGQDEIAELILGAVDPKASDAPLSFRLDPAKRVFMVSGVVTSPRQIAWIGSGDLLTYDFKTRRVQLGEKGRWARPAEFDPSAGRWSGFLSLVRRWETEHLLLERR